MFESHHKQQRIIVSLLPIVLLLVSPIVSRSQSMRGASGYPDVATTDNIQTADDGLRRLGWLFDMIQDLANQYKNVTEVTASPTASPVGRGVAQPLAEEVNKKKNGRTKNGKKKNEVV
ncbi:hypothetical protein ACHAW6_016167 [Cyclotella cf. meneghiniana]